MGLGYLVQLSYICSVSVQKYRNMEVNDKCALMKPNFTGRSKEVCSS